MGQFIHLEHINAGNSSGRKRPLVYELDFLRPAGEGVWNCTAGKVPGFGPSQPAFASWVGAFGDSTLIHSHKGTLTHEDIMDAQIVASKVGGIHFLSLFPFSERSVCISKTYRN